MQQNTAQPAGLFFISRTKGGGKTMLVHTAVHTNVHTLVHTPHGSWCFVAVYAVCKW